MVHGPLFYRRHGANRRQCRSPRGAIRRTQHPCWQTAQTLETRGRNRQHRHRRDERDDQRIRNSWLLCLCNCQHQHARRNGARSAQRTRSYRLAAFATSRSFRGVQLVRGAFAAYSDNLAGLVDRSLAEKWIDAEPREGKVGGAFCMSFVDDRSLVLLNWSGSVDSAQTTAHELGHAYHNTQLADRTPLQKRLPMALAETASI
ncbi:MAG: hypothetical protein EBY08_05505, partial [Actinobacteria bacterium]|nr:hypothetical protein [Actinomycetota bacterium]